MICAGCGTPCFQQEAGDEGDDDRILWCGVRARRMRRRPSLRVATFNAGLAYGFVDHADLRAPLLGPALEALDADVVCLQEVWTNADAQALMDAVKDTYPYQYREVPSDEGARPESRRNRTPSPRAGPRIDYRAEFGAISSGCQTCLASQLGKPLDEIVAVHSEVRRAIRLRGPQRGPGPVAARRAGRRLHALRFVSERARGPARPGPDTRRSKEREHGAVGQRA